MGHLPGPKEESFSRVGYPHIEYNLTILGPFFGPIMPTCTLFGSNFLAILLVKLCWRDISFALRFPFLYLKLMIISERIWNCRVTFSVLNMSADRG